MILRIVIILLAIHIVLVFFMTPPTKWADKFFSKFTRHPKLAEDSDTTIVVNGVQLDGKETSAFIQVFNSANYLYEGGILYNHGARPITIEIRQMKNQFVFKSYLYGDGMIEVIRLKRRKSIPYRLRSAALESKLQKYVLRHASRETAL